MGVAVTIGHAVENVGSADAVVFTSAARPDNVELVEARARRIPVIARAELLAELMRLRFGIAIAGAHQRDVDGQAVKGLEARMRRIGRDGQG